MIIFDENSQPLILDSLYTPIVTNSFWTLNLDERDFMLTKLAMLEETTCPCMILAVGSWAHIVVPTHWHVLVCDPDTTQLDAVSVGELAGKEFRAFVYGPTNTKHQTAVVRVLDYFPQAKNISPSLSRHQMLCHAIGKQHWICISPTDVFGKYLKDTIVGDIVQ